VGCTSKCSILLINLPGYHAYHSCHAYPSDYLNRIQWIQSTLQIVPITYDIPMTISDGFWLSMHPLICTPFHPGRNHGRSAPTGSFSDCSCSSSVVVILGSQISARSGTIRIGEAGNLRVSMDATYCTSNWYFMGYFMGVYDLPNWYMNFPARKTLKNYRRVYPPDLRIGIAWKFATSRKMRVQSVPPGCSFDDVFLHHFHVSNFSPAMYYRFYFWGWCCQSSRCVNCPKWHDHRKRGLVNVWWAYSTPIK
jgi:hypothetical protein